MLECGCLCVYLKNAWCPLSQLALPQVASQAEDLMNELFQDKGKVSDNSHQVSDSVRAYFDKIRKTLDHREKALLSTIHKYSDIKLTRLDIHYRTLEQHRTTILECTSKIQQLIENDDNVGLLSQKQTLSEDLDTHEQSVITLAESLVEARKLSSHLMFRDDQAFPSSVSELGTLNECRKEPNSLFLSLRRVIVTEEEDPYLDVPLRFEDMEGGEHMRIDESKEQVEYEPQSKPSSSNQSNQQVNSNDKDSETNIYNVPKPLPSPPVKPHVPPRRSSIERKPAATPQLQPTPDYYNAPRRPPKPPHLQPSTHDAQRKSVTLPRLATDISKAPNIIAHERQDSSDSDKSDYEPLLELPTPSPRTIPPPLPPNHPNRDKENRPIPRPRRQLSGQTTPPPTPPKPRCKTLPPRVNSHIVQPPPQAEILKPVQVIDNKALSWPYSHENVYPSGVCCCTELHDTVVVTDVFNHCLRLIDYKGKFIEKVGREGRSGGQFKEPSAVAVDSSGHIYVTERDNPRVQKFTSAGKYITKFGQKTLRGTQLSDPTAIAITSNGLIAVSDWDKNQIFFFSNGGKIVSIIAKENNFLKLPAGIAFNKVGHLLVADRGNHCVWELTMNGDLVRKIGSHGSNPGQLNFPYGIVVDDEDRIIVSESGNSRISVFSQMGDLIRCFGELGTEPGKFDHPRHLCLNSRKQLIVADEMNQRLQVFDNY